MVALCCISTSMVPCIGRVSGADPVIVFASPHPYDTWSSSMPALLERRIAHYPELRVHELGARVPQRANDWLPSAAGPALALDRRGLSQLDVRDSML